MKKKKTYWRQGLFLFLLCMHWLVAQSAERTVEGRVSYLSMRNVYVSFASTSGMSVGDTLFVSSATELLPVLLITQLSSISCVTQPIDEIEPEVGDLVVGYIPVTEKVVAQDKTDVLVSDTPRDSVKMASKETPSLPESSISGRFSLKSYTNLSSTDTDNSWRMRYTLSLQGEHLWQSKFSADSYINFTHKAGEWNSIQDNIFTGLKIYNLALKYDVSAQTNVWLGRKINPNMSNMGAIDGLQAETHLGHWTLGIAAGSRPDYKDYSFNGSLLQYGAFAAHKWKSSKGRQMQNSLALFEQTNSQEVDRRFAYFQHSNALFDKVNVFASCELDLYEKINGVAANTLSLTGLYVSLRYKPWKKLSLFTSYDARKNVIYYETYKILADQILENETRQGYRFKALWRPLRKLTVASNIGYRYRKGDLNASKNAGAFVTYSQLPWIDATATANFTLLSTNYLDGKQYGLSLSRDFLQGKIYSSLNYRIIDYQYASSLNGLFQHVGDISLSWRLPYRLQLSVDYETTFDAGDLYHRLFFGLSKRF